MPFLQKSLCLLVLACAAFTTSARDIPSEPYWLPQIREALQRRNSYFDGLGIDSDAFGLSAQDRAYRDSLLARLAANPLPENPWYNFVNGMILDSLHSRMSYHFGRALALAETDPGTTSLLMIEFARHHQNLWTERSLEQLEKQMLSSGATTVPAIAQILMTNGILNRTSGRDLTLDVHYWASRFDAEQVWPALNKAASGFPFKPAIVLSAAGELFGLAAQSWSIQLAALSTVHVWFRMAAMVFVVAVLLVCAIKYLPSALHPAVDSFPSKVPYSLRALMTAVVFCSLLSFGPLPFAWLLIFVVWKFFARYERVLVSVAMLLMIIAPLNVILVEKLSDARMPDSEIGMFTRSTHEGCIPGLYLQLREQSARQSASPLRLTTAAVAATKCGDLRTAREFANLALSRAPQDPLVATVAGNVLFLEEDFSGAQQHYATAIAAADWSVSARFNLAQCHLQKMETIEGTELIRDASRIGPDAVNAFIGMNDGHFSKDWPLLRRVMQPDLSPTYFWTRVFPRYGGSADGAARRWGLAFLGFSPIASFVISIVLVLALFAYDKSLQSGRSAKTLFYCRFCGRPVCRKCKKGMLCETCGSATLHVRNEKALDRVKVQLMNRSRRLGLIAGHLLDIFIPGVGALYTRRMPLARALMLSVISCFVYATYHTVLSATFYYPRWVLGRFDLIFLAAPLAYSVFFAVKGVKALVTEARAGATEIV